MMKKRLLILAVLVLLVLIAAGAGYLYWRGGRAPGVSDVFPRTRDDRVALHGKPVAAEPTASPTPDAAGVEQLLLGGDFVYGLSMARTLPTRDDIPAKQRASMLIAALQAEVAAPFAEDKSLKDSYLAPSEVMRLVLVRGLGGLGQDVIPAVRRAADESSGLAREHLLVALAYLGDREVLPAVREVLRSSVDVAARMDAARALGVAGDRDAIPDLQRALEDPYVITARDSLGEYTIYPVREQVVGALGALGVEVARQPDHTFIVEGS